MAGFAVIANPAHAQTSDADADARILEPLSVYKIADLDFGNIIAGPAAGTVFIDTRNGNRTAAGGVTLGGGTSSRADFLINGPVNQIVRISIPSTVTINRTTGSDSMRIDRMAIGNANRNFGSSVRARLSRTGVFSITVGGRLLVNANQPTGEYTGTFVMTVIYE
ncbi:DUF4402 domain-containing protein [Sphingorhabdus sp. Alg239-R122]|uniref:DUF4402 domain-containing protein n=1 Tax=Sphingorhabdus sp. Alg239-R122 TaxID=2305989 RepID=UPI0013DA6758|nr:DUF4402 domain-containing protein [Sphingorhabdus sp. Alg239-R122]